MGACWYEQWSGGIGGDDRVGNPSRAPSIAADSPAGARAACLVVNLETSAYCMGRERTGEGADSARGVQAPLGS